jgi:hypothetical protein
MTMILIAAAFVSLIASPALVAIWPQREPVEQARARTAGGLSSFSANTTAQRG